MPTVPLIGTAEEARRFNRSCGQIGRVPKCEPCTNGDWFNCLYARPDHSRLCVECNHYALAGPFQWCHGPHIATSLVNGSATMLLPLARIMGEDDPKLRVGVLPCGPEGRHWTPRRRSNSSSNQRSRLATPSWALVVGLVISTAFVVAAFFQWWRK